MKYLKITNGKTGLYSHDGALLASVGNNDSISSSLRSDGRIVIITAHDGSVKLYNHLGDFVREVKSAGAVSAAFIGSKILIFTQDGRVELWNDQDNFIKNL
jgi:hypothetical protein